MIFKLVILGIDPASTKIALVALSEDGKYMSLSNAKLGKSGGEACYNATTVTKKFLEEVQKKLGKISFAFIESPVVGRGGVRSTMVQCFTSGAIQAVLYEYGIPTQAANVSSWKKSVIGKGNATKEEVAEHLRYRWSALHKSANGNQDLVDASCIALYGQSIVGGKLV